MFIQKIHHLNHWCKDLGFVSRTDNGVIWANEYWLLGREYNFFVCQVCKEFETKIPDYISSFLSLIPQLLLYLSIINLLNPWSANKLPCGPPNALNCYWIFYQWKLLVLCKDPVNLSIAINSHNFYSLCSYKYCWVFAVCHSIYLL